MFAVQNGREEADQMTGRRPSGAEDVENQRFYGSEEERARDEAHAERRRLAALRDSGDSVRPGAGRG